MNNVADSPMESTQTPRRRGRPRKETSKENSSIESGADLFSSTPIPTAQFDSRRSARLAARNLNSSDLGGSITSPIAGDDSFFCNASLLTNSFMEKLDNIEREGQIEVQIEQAGNQQQQLMDQSQDMFSESLNMADVEALLDQAINNQEAAKSNGIKGAPEPPLMEAPNPPKKRKTLGMTRRTNDVKKPAGNVKKGGQGNKPKGKGRRGNPAFKVPYTAKKAAKELASSGQNELSRSNLSCLSNEQKLHLSSWGLPKPILNKYMQKGITHLFQWQLDTLENENVLEGKNLLYSAPTSAGKTMVAEILMVKRVNELGKKAIMILPFVSLAREKMYSLGELYSENGLRVEGFMGTYSPAGGFKACDIAVCTIERANSLINRLIEEKELSTVGTIVVDELHLLGDSGRGYLLELLLTKVRYLSLLSKQQVAENPDLDISKRINIQIIGMSATLPNLALLSRWLDSELVISNYRPVPLVELIKINDKLYNANGEEVRLAADPKIIPFTLEDDGDKVLSLSIQTIIEGHSILIFCPTKKQCEGQAIKISNAIKRVGNPSGEFRDGGEVGEKLREQFSKPELLKGILDQLGECPAGVDPVLLDTIRFGVAFHHAGLTIDERDIIEAAFKRNVLRVIVSTSTLSAGVNLPARRVIIRSPYSYASNTMDNLTYKQMCGRAGRKGIDTEGESILICNTLKQQEAGKTLIQSHLSPVSSVLLGNGVLTPPMKRAMLEVIASGIVTTRKQVFKYIQHTLFHLSIQEEEEEQKKDENKVISQSKKDEIVLKAIEYFKENDFINITSDGEDDKLVPTQLGMACLASSLLPDDSITVYKELQKARDCFVLSSDLHVVYLVTPIYIADQWQFDWVEFQYIWDGLPDAVKKVGELVGVEEKFIFLGISGRVSKTNPIHIEKTWIATRFFVALALNDLVNEMPLSKVATKYSKDKGAVQNLQSAASTFAGMVTAFCQKLGWSNLELIIGQFHERLEFGVQRELIELVKLKLVNGARARILYNAGIKTVSDLANSDPFDIEQIFLKAGPFISEVHGGQKSAVFVQGRPDILTEEHASRAICEEARQFLQYQAGELVTLTFGPRARKKPNNGQGSNESSRSESPRESHPSVEVERNTAQTQQSEQVPSTRVFRGNETLGVRIDTSTSNYETINRVSTHNLNTPRNSILEDQPRHSTPVLSPQSSQDTQMDVQIESMASLISISSDQGELKRPRLDITASEDLFGDVAIESPIQGSEDIFSEGVAHNSEDSETGDEADFSANSEALGPEVVVEKTLKNGRIFRTRTVWSVKRIPKSLYSNGKALGFGFRLAPKGVESLALEGIGSRIVRSDRRSKNTQEKEEALALYKEGENTIWVLKWHRDEPEVIAELLKNVKTSKCPVVCQDSKLRWKELILRYEWKEIYDNLPQGKDVWDPKIAQWLLDCNDNEPNLTFEADVDELEGFGWEKHVREAYASVRIMSHLKKELMARELWHHFVDVEMSCIHPTILLMELNGFAIDSTLLEGKKRLLTYKMSILELKAYELAKQQFLLGSPGDVNNILFTHLGLNRPKGTTGTSKSVLALVDHPIANVIMDWRKLESALGKSVTPFQKINKENGRVTGWYSHFNHSGRITMQDPSIQHVPRDIRLEVNFAQNAVSELRGSVKGKFGRSINQLVDNIDKYKNEGFDEVQVISIRDSFVAHDEEFTLLSADYAQLELRILAHLSGDPELISALNSGGDVIRSIVALWKGIPIEMVSDDLRQQGKALVYGIIYGQGAESLANEMDVSTEEARKFKRSFLSRFKGIEKFTKETKDFCRKNGFVETITGRRRYLPSIKSSDRTEKSKAERQAVNSKIQGSASDLVKNATIKIQKRLETMFESSIPSFSLEPKSEPKVAAGRNHFPILNLHDEVFFEVRKEFLLEIAREVRGTMEDVGRLFKVNFPVVLKAGPSWGTLTKYENDIKKIKN